MSASKFSRGETFCVVGENGSGKSTLLQICAGFWSPPAARRSSHGRVAALLELGSGFNPEFSGRDNVYLNGAILGLSTKDMDRRFPDIEAFAEIGDFINQPVKTYSSGMVVRLAFAVAIHVDPEILLVDEALAVGDVYFRQRCMRKVHELRAARRHDSVRLARHRRREGARRSRHVAGEGSWSKRSGRRTLWSRNISPRWPKRTAHIRRMKFLHRQKRERYQPPEEIVEDIPNIDHRFGDGKAEIIGIAVWIPRVRELDSLQPNSTIVVRISVRAKENLDRPIVGFMFRNHLGVDFAGTNTAREGQDLPPMTGRRCLHRRFLSGSAGAVCVVVFLLARDRQRIAGTLLDVRLDR